ncbi:MAG TPA: DinB family protein [Pyrinomonadaceae bacterium]|nr:DinB family protein [Pyrinomonadaceae bacterium]
MNKLIEALDREFARLHARSRSLVEAVPAEKLYWQPRPSSGASAVHSCGEHVLRSAARVEQTFGGITANLWDDPFEWTLPESLLTPARVLEYLDEVEATRRRGFATLRDDADLQKEFNDPSGRMRTLGELLFETLERAAHYQGRAYATFRLFSDAKV